MTGKRKSLSKKSGVLKTAEGADEFEHIDDKVGQFAKFPYENPNPVFRVDVRGKILYANPACTLLFKFWQTNVGEVVPKEWGTFIADAIKNETRAERECQIQEHTLLLTCAPVENTTYVNVYGFDITGHKHAEMKLRESEEKYRTLVEAADDAIVLTDLRGRLLFANSSYYANFGHGLKNGHLEEYSLVHPDDLPILATKTSELLEKGSLVTEYRVRHQDGHWAYRSAKSTLVKNDDGEPTTVLSITRDVSEQKRMEQELRESAERFRSTLDNMLEGCQIIDFDWHYLYVNDAVAQQGRSTKEALLHHTMMEIYPGIEDTELFTALHECMEQRVASRMENRFIFPDGSDGWFDLSIQPVPEGIFILSIDITERKKAEKALQESEARALAMLHAIPDLIFRMDREGTFLDFKAETKELYFQAETILGKRNRDVAPPAFADLIETKINVTLETGVLQRFEYKMSVPGKGVRDYEARMTVSGKNEVTAIVRDVTDRKSMETELMRANKLLEEQLGEIKILRDVLREQVIHDSLTGLYNRRYLDEMLDREIARAQREEYSICVLMMDIDGFKGFNDTYGHKVGDNVLTMLGNLLHDCIRKGDIACRYGGDEFVLIFPDTHVEDALRRAKEIGMKFAGMDLQIGHDQSNTTISVGVAAYPEHCDNGEELLKLADDALYRAKEAGRNLVYVWK